MVEGVRKPTLEELLDIALIEARLQTEAPDIEDVRMALEHLEGVHAVVFPDYASDSPGYGGRVAVVIWGSPEYASIYTERAGRLVLRSTACPASERAMVSEAAAS